MLIYEKDNKLNISFENNMEETDIVVGKDEVKIGEATISDNNVLPIAAPTDAGKVPTVQEDGSYALANTGGGTSTMEVEVVFESNNGVYIIDKTYAELMEAYLAGTLITSNGFLVQHLPPSSGRPSLPERFIIRCLFENIDVTTTLTYVVVTVTEESVTSTNYTLYNSSQV